MKQLTALIAICGLALSAGAAIAGESYGRGNGEVTNETLSKRPQVRGYYFRPGGYAYDYEYEPFLRRNGPYGNYPDLDTRNFRERVFSDPRFSVTSPSAF